MIDLTKGGRISLSKDDQGNTFDTIFFGTNWGMISRSFGLRKEAVDLDSSVVLLNSTGSHIDTVCYHKLNADGIHHFGDDLTGDADGDDGMDNETIKVQLSKLDPRVEHAFFVLNSFRHQTFDKIPYIGIRIYTTPDNKPKEKVNDPVNVLASFSLKEQIASFKNCESIILGEAYRKNGEWKFRAIGEFGNLTSLSQFPQACKQLL